MKFINEHGQNYIDNIKARSRDDEQAKMIVGSEIRELCNIYESALSAAEGKIREIEMELETPPRPNEHIQM